MSVAKFAWLSNSGSFVWRRRLAASKALKRFNADALLNRRIGILAPCRHGPFEPVSWACNIRVGFLSVPVGSEKNAVRSDGPCLAPLLMMWKCRGRGCELITSGLFRAYSYTIKHPRSI